MIKLGIIACSNGMGHISRSLKLSNYLTKYFELPKIILFEKSLFIIAENVKKAKEIEDVLKFQIMVFDKNISNDFNLLGLDELSYLGNWEAEKYRQKL